MLAGTISPAIASMPARLLQLWDAVLRLPGDSKGADNDVRIATERGIPVYFRLEDVPGFAMTTMA